MYGVCCHVRVVISQLLVLSSLLQMPFFILDLLLPITVDSKPEWNVLTLFPDSPLVNNLILLTVFVLQHR